MDKENEFKQTRSGTSGDPSMTSSSLVTSYGIDIDTASIHTDGDTTGQLDGLTHLGISAYEQETFEQQIIQQVNTQLAAKEIEAQKKIIKKEILGIEVQIRQGVQSFQQSCIQQARFKNATDSFSRKQFSDI